jgi:hypothetical protein
MDSKVKTLIDKFEHDVQLHSELSNLAYSKALLKLTNLGRGGLASIAEHLSATQPTDKNSVRSCWGMLLHDIALELEIETSPDSYNDLDGWIAWAEKEALSHAPN